MITGELKSQIDQIWNTFWTGGISNTITIVEQLTYLIFIKDLDETETRNERMSKRLNKEFTPIFGADQQDFRWKNLKEMDVNERHAIFSNTVDGIFPFIRSLGSEKSLFSTYMKGATFGISKPAVLDQVMEKLERLDMSNQDIKGDIYEYLLSKLEGGGTAGQFRTPRHIIKMMVQMMQPTLEDTISDPAAGTAGFLVAAKEYIDKHYDVTELDKHREHINKDMFSGSEFDATMLRIASMNLFLHGVEEPNIIDVDAISKDNDISDAYTLILANPPFKGTIDKESIAPGLRNVTDTTKTELLFLALMLRQLKKGGRAAVIVPDGVMFGSGKAYTSIREEIVANHKLEAVISLPSGIFQPYSGVSTAIIIFIKTDNGGTDNVWFYDMLADGKSLDQKRNLLVDADVFEAFSFGDIEDGLSAVEDLKNLHDKFNLPDIIKRFASLKYPKQSTEAQRKRTDQSFLVPFKEIKANDWDLSINRYKEIVYEEVEYDEPEIIMERLRKLNEERGLLMKQIQA
ncbi:type I restriction-modification system subunit M [Gelidibacter salicanalis]|uniref:site-specific DNA-methyltransferase (adenine-specific) n=1 Tax=Gelidibacter salicanalis TaxID=291193 RepID=A0A934KQX5_9FLAO|nr:class I SAM-dependent DNA methyltransferase [Gelidibacter salicanalis]MBJ7881874.1 SAM-dependent DNA methyltransferase [Gelidibacter salicanalis]